MCVLQRDYPRTYTSHLGSADARTKRQTDGYLPYRMAVYYVEENITNASTVIPWLNDPSQGFQMAINYLQSVLSVIRANHNLTLSPYCITANSDGQCVNVSETHLCGPHATVPDEHLGNITVCDPVCREVGINNTGVDADYIYYVTALDDGRLQIISTVQLLAMYNNDENLVGIKVWGVSKGIIFSKIYFKTFTSKSLIGS